MNLLVAQPLRASAYLSNVWRLEGVRTDDQYVIEPEKEVIREDLLPNLRGRAGYGSRKPFRLR